MSAFHRLLLHTAKPLLRTSLYAKRFYPPSQSNRRSISILATCSFLASAVSTSAISLYNPTPVQCEQSHNDDTKVDIQPEESEPVTAVMNAANAFLRSTWESVDGTWRLLAAGNDASSAAKSIDDGRTVSSPKKPGEYATPRTPKTDEFVASLSSSEMFIAQKVNELVDAIRAKIQASSPPNSQQPTTTVTVEAVTDARTAHSLPSNVKGSTRVAGTAVSQLVEELTRLVSDGINDSVRISVDLSPTKIIESIQSTTVAKKIDELTEAIRSERTVLLLSDLFLGENNILETIEKNLKNEELHPEIKWDAQVRVGRDLSQDEVDFVRARRLVVCEGLKRYLNLPSGVEVHEDDVPTIGVAGSGGGYRAMVSTIGSLIGLDNSGFLETSTYIGSISGSAWAVAQLFSIPTKSSSSDHADETITEVGSQTDAVRALAAGSSSTTENLRLLVTHVTDAIQCSPTSPKSILHFIQNINPDFVLGGLVSKQFSGGEISLVDAFGTLLGMRLLAPVAIAVIDAAKEGHEKAAAEKGEEGEGDVKDLVDVRFGLSRQKKSLKKGERPMPIYTAVRHERPGLDHGQVDRWETWEFTPYEIGCTEFGAFIPSWAFGRTFSAGKNEDRFPEPSLSLLLGMFGSAFCANAAQVYDEMRSLLPSRWIPQADEFFGGLNVSVSELQPIPPSGWHNPFHGLPTVMLPERLIPMEPQRNKFVSRVEVAVGVKVDSQDDRGIQNSEEKKRDAVQGRDNGNDVELHGHGASTIKKDGADGEVGKIIFANSDQALSEEDALVVEKEIHLMDAGLLNNLCVVPFIRPEREVDVLLVLDSSNDIADHDHLQRLAAYAKALGRKIGLPEEMNWEGRGVKNVVVWDPKPENDAAILATKVQYETSSHPEKKPAHSNPKDPEDHGCTVVYVPLLKNEKFDPDFDPQTAEFCSTFNFCYTPEETAKLIGLAQRNIEEADSSLKEAVRKSYERRRRRRLERDETETGVSVML